MQKKPIKSTTKTSKTVKVDSNIKQQVKDEKNNKKIIIISLILALLVAIFAYWQISKNNEEEVKKPTENKNDIVEKEDDSVEEENNDKDDSNFIGFVEEYVKPVKVDKDEETKEEEVIYYSLSFETNGGNVIEEQILMQNEVTSLVLPIKEGWVFQGWYADSDFTEAYTFGNVLTEDITIYAKWGKYISYMYQESLYEKENIV